jgi:tetratricopeptide (TPR) repeat protein
LEVSPNHGSALYILARLEQAVGSTEKAIERYESLREANPQNTRISLILAHLFEQTGEYAKAKNIYEELLVKHPKLWPAANNLAFYYAEHEPIEGNLKKAQELIAPWLTEHKDDPNLIDTAAWIAYRQGDYEKARELLLSVQTKAEDMPIFHYHLGMTYLRIGDERQARQHLLAATNAEKAFPGRTEALETLKEL